mgnify:CR=1 FL=1
MYRKKRKSWSNANKIRVMFVSRIQCTADGVNVKIETK